MTDFWIEDLQTVDVEDEEDFASGFASSDSSIDEESQPGSIAPEIVPSAAVPVAVATRSPVKDDGHCNEIEPDRVRSLADPGTEVAKSDHDDATQPKQASSSWHWLMASDGSYANDRLPVSPPFHNPTAAHNNNDNSSSIINNNNGPADPPPAVETWSSDSSHSLALVKTDPVKPKPKPLQLSWHWLLNTDGSHATINTAAAATSSSTTSPFPPERARKRATERALVSTKENKTVQNHDETDSGLETKRSSWHWLLAADGKYATANAPKRRIRSNIGTSPTPKRSSVNNRSKKTIHSERSWNGLLAPDGTPAAAHHDGGASTTAALARTRKRGRSVPPRNEPSDPVPPGSRRRRIENSETVGDRSESKWEEDGCFDADDREFLENSSRNNSNDEKWKGKFQLLVDYKHKHKHKTTIVPVRDTALGTWVVKQRRIYRAGNMSKYRQHCLESIGFVWEPHKDGWIEMYHWLLEYKEQHNGSIAVSGSSNKKYVRLAKWLICQRKDYNCNRLSEEKIHLLESIGFCLQSTRGDPNAYANKNTWMEMYRRLVAYKQKHESTQVPVGYEGDSKLGKWVKHQRQFCKEKYRIDLLNDIGFEWDPYAEAWMDMYKRLLAYQKKYGTTCVPFHFEADKKLGFWASHQRRFCTEKDRIDLLNAIGFEWNPIGDVWMDMYKRLQAYEKKHKTTRVPLKCSTGPKLGNWVHTQRKYCTRKDRIDLLNAIGFVWDARSK